MSDLPPPRRPVDPEEEHDLDLSAAAYERNVPGRLDGFRGTNPIVFIFAGVLAIGIVLFAALAFLHRGSSADVQRTAQLRAQEQAGPAAPGLGGPLQTPFIPASSPVPTPIATLAPIPPIVTLPSFVPHAEETPAPPAPAVPAVPVTPQIVPAPVFANSGGAAGQMKIDQPQSPSPGAAGAGAPAGDAGTHFEPVYRDGKLVSMVSVANSPAPAPQQTSATSAPQASSQFMSSGSSDPAALGESNAGLLEARKFAREDLEHEPGYVAPRAVRQLTTATVLNARLMSKIESDLPGPVIAQITEPVYDSNTHTTVVVPAGTRVFGKYDEETVASSTRLLMSFTHLIFPDGEEFDMGGQPGSDVNGTAGFGGDIDQHRGTLYTTALLLTVVGGAEAAVSPPTNSLTNGVTVTQAAQSSAGAQLDQLGNKILNRAIDRPATIIIRPPYAFEIIVTRDLPLEQYAEQHQ